MRIEGPVIETRDLRKTFAPAGGGGAERSGGSGGSGGSRGSRGSRGRRGAATPIVAVDRVSFDVRPGEIFGFLGPNGAGKTTTIKMLLGLVRPSAGEARVLGRRPGDPEAMARVGFLPEHFRFPGWLTAAELLEMHGRLYGIDAARLRVRVPELLERVGLGDRARTRLGEFSKGMSQRIGLAQAILPDPDLVVLDEPTSGLDPIGRREVREILREQRAGGAAVLLNSHLLGEVESTCDRIAILKAGRIARLGTLDQLSAGELEVEVHADGLTPALLDRLALSGGRVATAEPDGSRARLLVARKEDLPAIAEALVAGGARLYRFAPRRLSLEEMFVRILEDAR
ncbi:MAG: ATP-binding cassette domain-containing protein [Candidatus Eisenbacteria bacterium]